MNSRSFDPLKGHLMHEGVAVGVFLSVGMLNVDVGSALVATPHNRRELHTLLGRLAHEIAERLDREEYAIRMSDVSILVEIFPQQFIARKCPPVPTDLVIGDDSPALVEWESQVKQGENNGQD